MFPPAGQPVWPVSADSPNAPLPPLPSSDYCQSLRDQDPVTSPSPLCNSREKCDNRMNHCFIKNNSVFPKTMLGQRKLAVHFSPFCKGPDLPQLHFLFRYPCLNRNRSSQLGWLLLLGPQCARSQAFPLWSGGFYSRETNYSLSS